MPRVLLYLSNNTRPKPVAIYRMNDILLCCDGERFAKAQRK